MAGPKQRRGLVKRFTRPQQKCILIGVGMYRYPDPETVNKIIGTMYHFAALDTGYVLDYKSVTACAIPDTRGKMVDHVLSDPTISHALFIDDDMNWPLGEGFSGDGSKLKGFNPLERLLMRDKDVVGALCFSRDPGVTPYVGRETPDGMCEFIQDPAIIGSAEPFQVDFIGFGMVLIKRKVFERVALSMGLNPGHDSMAPMFRGTSNWRHDARAREEFARALAQYNVEIGLGDVMAKERLCDSIDSIQGRTTMLLDDFGFCRRARQVECEVWCDPSFDCVHIGRYSYGRMDWLARHRVLSEAAEEQAAN